MKDAAKVVTEITFYFSALQNINLLFFIMFVSWQIPIACLQNFRARFRKMYTEWLLLTAEWCIFSYILLHIKCLITRIRLQSADHKKHEIQISHVFCIFPYFSEIFRNFPGNFPEIFRNIIFRKIYITTRWWLTLNSYGTVTAGKMVSTSFDYEEYCDQYWYDVVLNIIMFTKGPHSFVCVPHFTSLMNLCYMCICACDSLSVLSFAT